MDKNEYLLPPPVTGPDAGAPPLSLDFMPEKYAKPIHAAMMQMYEVSKRSPGRDQRTAEDRRIDAESARIVTDNLKAFLANDDDCKGAMRSVMLSLLSDLLAQRAEAEAADA